MNAPDLAKQRITLAPFLIGPPLGKAADSEPERLGPPPSCAHRQAT
jgi:hypothetical protein